jgi:APA family basic amino acid/polyamine antiporter
MRARTFFAFRRRIAASPCWNGACGKGGVRTLGLDSAMALVVGEVIGIGIFLTPAEMTRSLGSPFWIFAVWVAVGAAVLCGSLCYGELAARFPEAGGGYVYLREAWGRGVAFLYGWKCLLVMDPGLTAALGAGIGRYAAALAPLGERGQKGIAMLAILLLALTSALGVRIGGSVVRLLTITKLVLLGVIIVCGLLSATGRTSSRSCRSVRDRLRSRPVSLGASSRPSSPSEASGTWRSSAAKSASRPGTCRARSRTGSARRP